MQSELAIDYLQLRGVNSQLSILADTIEAYRKSVDLTSRRLQVGFRSASDLALTQTQLDQTIARATGTRQFVMCHCCLYAKHDS